MRREAACDQCTQSPFQSPCGVGRHSCISAPLPRLFGAAHLHGKVEPAADRLPFPFSGGERPAVHSRDDDVIQFWPGLGSTQEAHARRVTALGNKRAYNDHLLDRMILQPGWQSWFRTRRDTWRLADVPGLEEGTNRRWWCCGLVLERPPRHRRRLARSRARTREQERLEPHEANL